MKRVILSLTALGTCAAIMFSLFGGVFAAPSDEIQKEIDRLEEQADELADKQKEIENQLAAKNAETAGYAEEKMRIDNELELARLEAENLSEQLHQYNLLIAEKQAELDELTAKQDDLLAHYKARMRAIQERGEISQWAVIFQAESFADMLNRRAMVEEIAKSDQRMMAEVREMADAVLAAKSELSNKKLVLEQKKVELADAETALEQKREESDQILTEMAKDKEKLKEAALAAEKEVADLDAQIAQKEKELTEAKKKEGPGTPTEAGFIFPVSLSGYQCVTSPYGYRTHPITGNYTLHNGIDLAAVTGTPIYAAKTGTVSIASNGYGWGNYVVINHGDGYSTLYGHMTNYIVAAGQTVTQGQVIGYVGSTGNSTGPHLHFTVYYNGASINPVGYIAIP